MRLLGIFILLLAIAFFFRAVCCLRFVGFCACFLLLLLCLVRGFRRASGVRFRKFVRKFLSFLFACEKKEEKDAARRGNTTHRMRSEKKSHTQNTKRQKKAHLAKCKGRLVEKAIFDRQKCFSRSLSEYSVLYWKRRFLYVERAFRQ